MPLISIVKAMHNEETKKKKYRTKRGKTKWEDLSDSDKYYYADLVQPVLDAIETAGYVLVPRAELAQAHQPLKRMRVARPKIRLGPEGGSIDLREVFGE